MADGHPQGSFPAYGRLHAETVRMGRCNQEGDLRELEARGIDAFGLEEAVYVSVVLQSARRADPHRSSLRHGRQIGALRLYLLPGVLEYSIGRAQSPAHSGLGWR